MLYIYLSLVLINLVLCFPSSWRLAHFFMYEEGPLDIFVKFRKFLNVSEDFDERYEGNFWSRLLSCIRCTSVWTAVISIIIALSGVGILILLPLAISTYTIVLDEKVQ